MTHTAPILNSRLTYVPLRNNSMEGTPQYVKKS